MKLPKAKQPAKGKGKSIFGFKKASKWSINSSLNEVFWALFTQAECVFRRFPNRSTNVPFFSRDFGETLKDIYEHAGSNAENFYKCYHDWDQALLKSSWGSA